MSIPFKQSKKILFMSQSAMIAALYVTLVFVFQPISFSGIQCRIAEMLTILPFFTPAAVPGLTIGCLLANIFGGADILDIVFGTLATGMASYVSYILRKNKWLVPIPPILFNTLIIPFVLRFAYMETTPLPLLALSIFIGQLLSCGVLGMFLLLSLEKYKLPFIKIKNKIDNINPN